MKTNKYIYLILALILVLTNLRANSVDEDPNVIIEEMITEMKSIQQKFDSKILVLNLEITEINQSLIVENNIEQKVNLLIKKDQIRDNIALLLIDEQTEMTKVRYLKGLEVIKILYDKVLALDHHFASVVTFSEINKITNPNQYPEFIKVKDIVREKRDKKYNLDLTSILGANPYTSITNVLLSLFGSSLSSQDKQNELEQIECILDFTLKMHQDLNTIYFETSYLQASNTELKMSIEQLFKDYTKPLGYFTTLEECRKNDDWSSIHEKLKSILLEIEIKEGPEQIRALVNVEFPVDRLLVFLNQYNDYINQGVQFYQKFKVILNSYENEEQCKSKLPIEYEKLKKDVDVSIEKFNVAYRPVEINGSKMKEILYGINEYN